MSNSNQIDAIKRLGKPGCYLVEVEVHVRLRDTAQGGTLAARPASAYQIVEIVHGKRLASGRLHSGALRGVLEDLLQCARTTLKAHGLDL